MTYKFCVTVVSKKKDLMIIRINKVSIKFCETAVLPALNKNKQSFDFKKKKEFRLGNSL